MSLQDGGYIYFLNLTLFTGEFIVTLNFGICGMSGSYIEVPELEKYSNMIGWKPWIECAWYKLKYVWKIEFVYRTFLPVIKSSV